MNYGKALRIARAIIGLEQRELAEKAGVDPSHISLMESGARQPSTRTISKLSKALGIPEPLFAMLATERSDLQGISEEEFGKIGTHFARFLIDNAQSRKHNKPKPIKS